MLRDDFPLIDPLNYSVLTVIPTELYSISKTNFSSFVKDRALLIYQANLITLHPDWVLRKAYVNNTGWEEYRTQYVEQKRAEMKMSKSALKTTPKSRSVSTQRQIKYHARNQATTDFMVNLDLAYVHRADETDPYTAHQEVGVDKRN
jgi:hypothetical protein